MNPARARARAEHVARRRRMAENAVPDDEHAALRRRGVHPKFAPHWPPPQQHDAHVWAYWKRWRPDRRGVVVRAVIEAVAADYGVDAAVLTLPDDAPGARAVTAFRPRQVAMYLAGIMTDLGCAEIGRRFNRDHSAVLAAQRRVRGQMLAGMLPNVAAIREKILAEEGC